ncbi:LysR family transcriptional regulator [Shewanella seohaensis]|uniref:LysR family transcriptional regulator n=1 Tax=Shewanella seohaensis TaxID=755175 RepID=UPI002010829A|nr:LysR family transcriptional regulator [Shewanella seohaensis]MCL1122555.1 LysR family transcriptional regulator [Shewanella seohaensis]UXM80918.1 LysR family transcriptional regulator [Shewanella seohaensis]
MNFSLEQLLAFVTVYEHLSFSKAAVKLNKHRTTIGQVITNLEDQLAVTLFERIGRSVEPTEDGHLLYHYAKQAIEQARVFDKIALSLSYGELERVVIAYPSFIPHQALYLIRKQLVQDFPTLRVEFLVRDRAAIKHGIVDGSIHFGIVNIHDSTAIHSMDTAFLGHVEFLPYVQEGGKFASMEPAIVGDLLKTERQFILKSLVDEGLGDKFVLSANNEQVDQLALIIKMIKEGLGWAWLPKALSESQFALDGVVPVNSDMLFEGLKLPISLWCPHSKSVKNIKASIIKAIADHVKKYHLT